MLRRAECCFVTITLTPFSAGRAGPTVAGSGTLRELLSAGADELVWIDASRPTAEEMAGLQETLELPPLAVEDALEAQQRPKVDQYERCVFVVVYEAALDGGAPDARLELGELALFVGARYFLTVRQREPVTEDSFAHRLLTTEGHPLRTTTAMAHAVLDHIVDEYYAVTESLESRIEDIDDMVWSGIRQDDLTRAFALRRDLVRFRRVVAPLREVLNVLVRHEGGVLDDAADEYLRDLYDHVVTVYEEIEMSRDLLAGALEGHLAVVSNRMNEVVLKVSAWAAIIAVPTVIASIYGMNFVRMPELRWHLGYPMALAMMVAAALSLYLVFKQKRWI
jgi:magnesium transporter